VYELLGEAESKVVTALRADDSYVGFQEVARDAFPLATYDK
jgi:hypothetical protein